MATMQWMIAVIQFVKRWWAPVLRKLAYGLAVLICAALLDVGLMWFVQQWWWGIGFTVIMLAAALVNGLFIGKCFGGGFTPRFGERESNEDHRQHSRIR